MQVTARLSLEGHGGLLRYSNNENQEKCPASIRKSVLVRSNFRKRGRFDFAHIVLLILNDTSLVEFV